MDDATKWLDCRAQWATVRQVPVADSAACPSIASSELVARPLESISIVERGKTKVSNNAPGTSR